MKAAAISVMRPHSPKIRSTAVGRSNGQLRSVILQHVARAAPAVTRRSGTTFLVGLLLIGTAALAIAGAVWTDGIAIAIGRGQMPAALRSSTAGFGFMLGAAVATAMGGLWREEQTARRGLRCLLLFEIVCLGSCAALWSASDDQVRGSVLYAIIGFATVSMGIQGTAARRINQHHRLH
jgi:hypothetical protein